MLHLPKYPLQQSLIYRKPTLFLILANLVRVVKGSLFEKIGPLAGVDQVRAGYELEEKVTCPGHPYQFSASPAFPSCTPLPERQVSY